MIAPTIYASAMKGTTSSAMVVTRFCPPTMTTATSTAMRIPLTQPFIPKALARPMEMEFACTIQPMKPRATMTMTEKMMASTRLFRPRLM